MGCGASRTTTTITTKVIPIVSVPLASTSKKTHVVNDASIQPTMITNQRTAPQTPPPPAKIDENDHNAPINITQVCLTLLQPEEISRDSQETVVATPLSESLHELAGNASELQLLASLASNSFGSVTSSSFPHAVASSFSVVQVAGSLNVEETEIEVIVAGTPRVLSMVFTSQDFSHNNSISKDADQLDDHDTSLKLEGKHSPPRLMDNLQDKNQQKTITDHRKETSNRQEDSSKESNQDLLMKEQRLEFAIHEQQELNAKPDTRTYAKQDDSRPPSPTSYNFVHSSEMQGATLSPSLQSISSFGTVELPESASSQHLESSENNNDVKPLLLPFPVTFTPLAPLPPVRTPLHKTLPEILQQKVATSIANILDTSVAAPDLEKPADEGTSFKAPSPHTPNANTTVPNPKSSALHAQRQSSMAAGAGSMAAIEASSSRGMRSVTFSEREPRSFTASQDLATGRPARQVPQGTFVSPPLPHPSSQVSHPIQIQKASRIAPLLASAAASTASSASNILLKCSFPVDHDSYLAEPVTFHSSDTPESLESLHTVPATTTSSSFSAASSPSEIKPAATTISSLDARESLESFQHTSASTSSTVASSARESLDRATPAKERTDTTAGAAPKSGGRYPAPVLDALPPACGGRGGGDEHGEVWARVGAESSLPRLPPLTQVKNKNSWAHALEVPLEACLAREGASEVVVASVDSLAC
ncbi:hypothetical protein BC830DRAFT_472097 [Chytriomyces sp. MP71]|nr:hypothetical protein BC830DRAFT_472097 [Chytriomyces sp. MP71]